MNSNSHFQIIQGGMGVGISNWNLARAVSQNGGLGVVSGTGIDTVFIRRLQLGDPQGHMQRAMEKFPVQEIAERIFEEYFVPGGKPDDAPFKNLPLARVENNNKRLQITVLANFAEVSLAKEGHNNPVGINYLEKIQLQHLPSIYGAMLAGVDYVLMGAGIPRQIPAIMDGFVNHEPRQYKLYVEGAKAAANIAVDFDPKQIIGIIDAELKRPDFLAVISSYTLALTLARKTQGKVNGFIIEGPTAGGHNASPRGNYLFNEKGEPIYGTKDNVDLDQIASLGLPFWLAGGYGRPERLEYALSAGANGIQVGTLFFLCEESGLDTKIKQDILKKLGSENLVVFTDSKASPTGFPFKVLSLDGTNSEKPVYDTRIRLCDLGYLRIPYEEPDGSINYRCASEPVDAYTEKGGSLEDTVGKKCLCNALMANIGLPQVRRNRLVEQPLLTAGDDINQIRKLITNGNGSFSAVDVMNYLVKRS